MNKFFKNLKDKVDSFYSTEGTSLDKDIFINSDICKVSIVGLGMKTNVGVANTMFTELANNNINIHVISTSEIKISVLIDEKYKELAIRSLHSIFKLNSKKK